MGVTPILAIFRNMIEIIAYSVFFLSLDNPKFSWKKTCLYYLVFIIFLTGVGTVWVLFEPVSYLKYCTMVLFLCASVFFSLMSQDTFLQSLYKLTLQMFILFFLIYVGIWIAICFFDRNPWADIGVRICYAGIGFFICRRWIRKPFRKIVDGFNHLKFQWKEICIIAIAGNFLILFYATRPTHIIVRSYAEQMMFLGTCALLLVTHIVMLHTLYLMQKEMGDKQEMELTAISNEMLKRELELMQEHVEEANRIRHDVRHHDLMVAEYIQRGETHVLLEYLKQHEQEYSDLCPVKICENLVVDHILRIYIRKAEQKGIQVFSDIKIQKETGIRETDFIAILGNIMENALHGCEESGSNNQQIAVQIWQKAGKLVIQVKNTCFSQINFENGLPVRKNGRGLGVLSIVHSVRKYLGDVDFQMEQGMFVVRVLLPILK